MSLCFVFFFVDLRI